MLQLGTDTVKLANILSAVLLAPPETAGEAQAVQLTLRPINARVETDMIHGVDSCQTLFESR